MRRILLSLAVATAFIAPAAGVAHASGSSAQRFTPRYLVHNVNLGVTHAGNGVQLPLAHFHDTFTAGGTSYGYYMVGQDPFTHPNARTTINVTIIPIDLTLESGNNGGDFNGSETTTDFLGSPIFQANNFASGVTQLLDANQRAEFWSVIGSGYHVFLNPTVAAPVNITVPAADGVETTTGTGVKIANVNIHYWSSALKTAAAQTPGISADMLPIFMTKDTYLNFGNPNACCVLGYHGAYKDTTKNIQTFAWASYGTPNAFGPGFSTADITAVSHEVSEWANDPFTVLPNLINTVPNWESPYAPQYGCNSFLEVGDPVAGLAFQVHMRNGLTYHPEDEVFFSWFAQQSPSIALDGRYTFLGTFTGPNTGCG